jgi:hypothetical protein
MTHPDNEREACMKLEPCPFCGSVAAMVTYGSGNSHASCNDPNQLCMIDGPVRSSPEAAAEAWNTRAHADAKDALAMNPDSVRSRVWSSAADLVAGYHNQGDWDADTCIAIEAEMRERSASLAPSTPSDKAE